MTPAETALAIQLAEQGISYWTTYKAQAAAGQLTQADLVAAGNKLGVDIAQLAADIAAKG
jgi:hypothetical protein